MKQRSSLIILLFIVSAMLIGIFSGGGGIYNNAYHGNEISDEVIIKDHDTTSLIEATENTAYENPGEQTKMDEETEEEELQWWDPGPWYLEYEGIEPLTEEQMLQIRIEWAEEWYDYKYRTSYNQYIKSCSEKDADKFAAQEAQEKYDKNINILFNEYYYNKYSYIGIINDCVIISNCDPRMLWTVTVGDRKIEGGRQYVLKDGEFYHLTNAYKNGWLTDEDLDVLYNKIDSLAEARKIWEEDVQRRKDEKIEFKGEETCEITES